MPDTSAETESSVAKAPNRVASRARPSGLGVRTESSKRIEFYRLDALYCTLDAAGRRRRFGAGVSDASIRSHCETLREQEALVIVAFKSNRMDAAIELWPFSSAWEQAEIAVVARRYAYAPLKTLMRLAADGEIVRIDISITTAPFSGRTSGYDVRADETFELR